MLNPEEIETLKRILQIEISYLEEQVSIERVEKDAYVLETEKKIITLKSILDKLSSKVQVSVL